MISELKKLYGPQIIGLKINHNENLGYPLIRHTRFCEAACAAFKEPLLFFPENLICYGGRRSMGTLKSDFDLIRHIAKESGIAIQTIKMAIEGIPKLDKQIDNIAMGINEKNEKTVRPDMLLIYTEPDKLIEMARLYTQKTDLLPTVSPYPFLSICGNIFVNTYKSRNMCVSLGCPDARNYGGLKNTQVIVGLPYDKALQMFN